MSTNFKLAALFLLLLSGAWGLWGQGEQEALPEVESEPVEVAVTTEKLTTPLQAESSRRTLQIEPEAEAELLASVTAAPLLQIEGRLVDLNGNPLGAKQVIYLPPGASENDTDLASAISTTEGAFEIELPSLNSVDEVVGSFRIQEQGFATVVPGKINGAYHLTGQNTCTVLAARVHRFQGRVTNGAMEVLEGVELTVELNSQVFSRAKSEESAPLRGQSWSTTSASDGSYELEAVPGGSGIELRVTAAGYPTRNIALPSHDDSALDIVLSAPPGGEKMWGLVVGPDGVPVEGAMVSTGAQSVRTDAEGHFELNRERSYWGKVMDQHWGGEALRAVKPGFLPAQLREVDDIAPPIRLVLGGPPLRIRGRVVNQAGSGMGGAAVWCKQLTRFGFSPGEDGRGGFGAEQSLEGILGGQLSVRADQNGYFELQGLLDKEYTVCSLMPGSMAMGADTLVQAGSDGIRLLIDAPSVMVSGHVLGLDGSPLANLPVQAMRPPQEGGNPWSGLRASLKAPHTKTDENGYFELGPMAIKGNTLSIIGREIREFHVSVLENESDLQDIEILVAMRATLQVNLERDLSLADSFSILDEKEQIIAIHVAMPGGMMEKREGQITEGLSQVIQTTQLARWLVLTKRGVEVQRLRLDLTTGELNEIRP